MFLRSIKEVNRLISKGMPNIYFNSSYWEKLTSSKLRFSKFKRFVFRSIFGELKLMQILLNFKTGKKTRWPEKKLGEAFIYLCFFFAIFHFNRIVPRFSFLFCGKTWLNITHNKNGISKYPPQPLLAEVQTG